MANQICFKSYCWAVGTTSYRTDKFNMNIELQLALLKEFWELPEQIGGTWRKNNALQARYYRFLKSREFVKGDAPRPDKDAREKTSGLRDIGLLDDGRQITEAGLALLKIAQSGDFTPDNLLEIPKDSYLYFKQLLKTACCVDQTYVRPFVVFLYAVSRLDYLTYEEFTYLLPLCIDRQTTEKVIEGIRLSRLGALQYEEILLSVLMEMENYRQALQLLQGEEIEESVICNIGINRKSARYDKPYYILYQILHRIAFQQENLALELLEATKKLTNGKVGGAWRKYFFRSVNKRAIAKGGLSMLNPVKILQTQSEQAFRREFFRIMHLFKAKATLADYFDLNRRYFKITGLALFEDGRVKLDILPKCYIGQIADRLPEFAFTKTKLLEKDVPLEAIHASLTVDSGRLYRQLGQLLQTPVFDKASAHSVIKKERYDRMQKLIDEKFDNDTLITLLSHFENRKDEEIRAMVTDNADIPTIFEYVLAIVWYILSGRTGDVLAYMNLSLETDLLPKTHAGGGKADIVWQYEKTEAYPKHTLLLEATLADGANQRRMEMEPVSRHLGDYCLEHKPELKNEEAYCIFVTTFLNTNVISDFRARRFMEYYNAAGTDYVTGLKILPMQTAELKKALKSGITYPQIYKLLDQAHNSGGAPKEWYETQIAQAGVWNGV